MIFVGVCKKDLVICIAFEFNYKKNINNKYLNIWGKMKNDSYKIHIDDISLYRQEIKAWKEDKAKYGKKITYIAKYKKIKKHENKRSNLQVNDS